MKSIICLIGSLLLAQVTLGNDPQTEIAARIIKNIKESNVKFGLSSGQTSLGLSENLVSQIAKHEVVKIEYLDAENNLRVFKATASHFNDPGERLEKSLPIHQQGITHFLKKAGREGCIIKSIQVGQENPVEILNSSWLESIKKVDESVKIEKMVKPVQVGAKLPVEDKWAPLSKEKPEKLFAPSEQSFLDLAKESGWRKEVYLEKLKVRGLSAFVVPALAVFQSYQAFGQQKEFGNSDKLNLQVPSGKAEDLEPGW